MATVFPTDTASKSSPVEADILLLADSADSNNPKDCTIANVDTTISATTKTLTNKTINLASNNVTGTTAEFNSALSDGSFATWGGTATWTNTWDQTITLTWDVTWSGTWSFAATIAADSVTYDKMQDTTWTDVLLWRSTAWAWTVEEVACTAAGRALLDDADASAQRTTLWLAIWTDIQAFDNDLSDIAALTHTKGNIMVSNGTDWINVWVGTNDQVLTADSAETAWVKWAAAWGGWSSSAPLFQVNEDGVQVVAKKYTFVCNWAITAWTFRASLWVLPTWADFIIKLYKNWTEDASITIATTDSATNWLYQWTDTSFVSWSYVAWDVLTVETTQIGSTIAWADLTFSLYE